MRGGGKNASCSATENRLLEGLRELLKTVDETPSHTQAEIGGEAKLLADLKNLIHQHKKGCLLQQLKSLVTQATRSQHAYSEPGRKKSVDTGKRQTFYGSWKNVKNQDGGGKQAKPDSKSWAQVVSGAHTQWTGSDGWTEFVWKPRQEDWQVEDKSAVQVVTSLDRLEHKLEENNKTPLVAVTSDVEELTTTLEMVGGDANCRVTVLYSSVSDLPDEVARWQMKASRGRVPGQLSGKLQSRVVWVLRLHDASPKLATKTIEKVKIQTENTAQEEVVVRFCTDACYSWEAWSRLTFCEDRAS